MIQKNALNDAKSKLQEKVTLLTEVRLQLSKVKAELQKNIEQQQNNELTSLKEEHKIIKNMVVEKDNFIKNLRADHEKEISSLKLEKKAAEEALNSATRENVTMKDKESTLLDVFKSMKKYMDQFSETSTEVRSYTCDQCSNAFVSSDQLSDHVKVSHKKLQCEYCDYEDNEKGNLTNHVLTVHTQFKCHLCSFASNNGKALDDHFTHEHFQPTFVCTECDSSFHTARMLKEHQRKHRLSDVNCDYCGDRLKSFSDLDEHISTYHNIKNRQYSDITRERNHSIVKSTFSKPERIRSYTSEEKLQNGPCFNWMENRCRFGESCKFAHIKICRHQENCRAPRTCEFYHFNSSNIDFLGRQTMRRPFNMNMREFPPLQSSQRLVPRRMK